MKNDLLEVGDVIDLKKGMKVYADIPEKFVYSNKLLSKEFTECDVQIGEVYTCLPNVSKVAASITKDILERFEQEGVKLNKTKASGFVKSNLKEAKSDSFTLKGGEFLVLKTELTGGSRDMARGDVYPDGHYITCQRLKNGKYDEKGTVVSFYQSGSFTAMIEYIEPVRSLKRKIQYS